MLVKMSLEVKICPDCLLENDIDAKLCYNCGHDFQNKSEYEFDINIFYDIDDLIDDAILVYKGENYKHSLDLINSYLDEYPEDLYAWTFKAHVLAKLNYINDAITCCNIALNFDDMFIHAWSSKAYFYYQLENYEAAMTCCNTVLILESENPFNNDLIDIISKKIDSEAL